MTPHSSTLAWEIPWMEEPGGLQSMESLRVRHDWATSISLFTFMHWRRKCSPVFLPGESRDEATWCAAVYGVAQSETRLKQLSSSSKTSWRHHHSLGFAGVNPFLGECRAVAVWMLGWAGCCASGDIRASLPGHMALGWVCSPPFILHLVHPPWLPALFRSPGSITGICLPVSPSKQRS